MAHDPNCGIPEYCPTVAERCFNLIPSYEIVRDECDKIWVRWNGTGDPDFLEWHFGQWGTGPLPTGNGIPIGQFDTYAVILQEFNLPAEMVVFTCIPPGDWSIVLVAKVGNCPAISGVDDCATSAQVVSLGTGGQGCLLCGYAGGGSTVVTSINTADCCIKMFDLYNDLDNSSFNVHVDFCACVGTNSPPYVITVNAIPQALNPPSHNYPVAAGATVVVDMNEGLSCTFVEGRVSDNASYTPYVSYVADPLNFTMPDRPQYVRLDCSPPILPPPPTTNTLTITPPDCVGTTMGYVGTVPIETNIANTPTIVFTYVTGVIATIQICSDGVGCLCPTTLIINGIPTYPNRVNGTCAEWDILMNADKILLPGVDSNNLQCSPCTMPYNCATPPRPSNVYLVEAIYAQGGNFNPTPCANLLGNGTPPFAGLALPGFISIFAITPVKRMWVGQGNTLRIGVNLDFPAPLPTLSGMVNTGFELANPLQPYWDIVINQDTLFVFDTSSYPLNYFNAYPGTIYIIDPC